MLFFEMLFLKMRYYLQKKNNTNSDTLLQKTCVTKYNCTNYISLEQNSLPVISKSTF